MVYTYPEGEGKRQLFTEARQRIQTCVEKETLNWIFLSTSINQLGSETITE